MSKTFTATQLASDMNLNPKKVRAILRKAGYQRPGTRWTFDNSEKSRIRAVIREATKKASQPRRRKSESLPSYEEEGMPAAVH